MVDMALSFDDACLGHGGPVRQETPDAISRHLATRAPSSSPALSFTMASYDAVAVSSTNIQHSLFNLIHAFRYRHCTRQSRPSLLTSPSASSPTSPSSSSWPPLASHSTSPRKHCACPIQPPLLRMSLINCLVYQKQPSFAKSQSHPPPASSEGSVSWPCSTRSACICSILGVGEQYTARSDVGIRGSGATTGSVVGTPAVFAFHALRPSPRVSTRS